MRVAPAIYLSSKVQTELHRLVRRRTTRVRVAEGCSTVLLAAAGLQDKQILTRLISGHGGVKLLLTRSYGDETRFLSESPVTRKLHQFWVIDGWATILRQLKE